MRQACRAPGRGRRMASAPTTNAGNNGARPRSSGAKPKNAVGGRGANKGLLTPFLTGKTSKSSDCRGRTGRKSRLETGAVVRDQPRRRRTSCFGARDLLGSATTSPAGAKLDLDESGDLFSVFRARLAADSGRNLYRQARRAFARRRSGLSPPPGLSLGLFFDEGCDGAFAVAAPFLDDGRESSRRLGGNRGISEKDKPFGDCETDMGTLSWVEASILPCRRERSFCPPVPWRTRNGACREIAGSALGRRVGDLDNY